MTADQFASTDLPGVVFLCHAMADFFATKAPGECQVQAQGLAKLNDLKDMVNLVHNRLLSVMLRCFQFEVPVLDRVPPKFIGPAATMAIKQSGHSIVAKVISGAKRWQCSTPPHPLRNKKT